MRISSCFSICFLLFGLGIAGLSNARELELPAPFVALKDFAGYKTVSNSEIVIPNMPRIRDQKHFDICFGMAPTVLAQKHICKLNGIKDCADLPAELEISPLSTMSWFQKNSAVCSIRNGKYFIDAYESEVDADECGLPAPSDTEATSYSSVRFVGNAYLTLKNASTLFSFHSEACFSTDRFFKKFGHSAEAARGFINDMKKFYFSNRNKEISCSACLVSQATKYMNTTKVNEDIVRAALKKKNFEQFMYQMMFGDCPRIHYAQAPKFKQLPDIPLEYIVTPRDNIQMALGGKPQDEVFYMHDNLRIKVEKLSRVNLLEKSKEILQQGYPLMLDNVCVKRDEDERCLNKHSIVITGYKEVCNTSECKKFLQLHNSWGREWQDSFAGGWVDAVSLLANVDTDEIRPGILSWYED